MAHADDATKTWISAIPTKNSDGNVTEWKIKYKYTLAVSGKDDFVKTFEKILVIENPSKAPNAYTKSELLSFKKNLKSSFNNCVNSSGEISSGSSSRDTFSTHVASSIQRIPFLFT